MSEKERLGREGDERRRLERAREARLRMLETTVDFDDSFTEATDIPF